MDVVKRYFTSYLVDAEATFQNGQLQATSIEELSGEVSEKSEKEILSIII